MHRKTADHQAMRKFQVQKNMQLMAKLELKFQNCLCCTSHALTPPGQAFLLARDKC